MIFLYKIRSECSTLTRILIKISSVVNFSHLLEGLKILKLSKVKFLPIMTYRYWYPIQQYGNFAFHARAINKCRGLFYFGKVARPSKASRVRVRSEH